VKVSITDTCSERHMSLDKL